MRFFVHRHRFVIFKLCILFIQPHSGGPSQMSTPSPTGPVQFTSNSLPFAGLTKMDINSSMMVNGKFLFCMTVSLYSVWWSMVSLYGIDIEIQFHIISILNWDWNISLDIEILFCSFIKAEIFLYFTTNYFLFNNWKRFNVWLKLIHNINHEFREMVLFFSNISILKLKIDLNQYWNIVIQSQL